MRDDFASLAAYNRWADDRIVTAVRRLTLEQYTREPAPECRSVHGTLIHMADAALIWLRRINGEAVTERTAEATIPTLEDAVQFLSSSHEAFAILLPTLSSEVLASELSYHDLQGKPQSLPMWVVLRHLINHSSYHRGQITSRLMDFGIEPPLMDLALWAMQY